MYTPPAVISTNYFRAYVIDSTGTCRRFSEPFKVVSDSCTNSKPINIPNALTDNGDGSNDVFYIYNIWLYPSNHLIIYNRWGSKVYESDGYLNTWDGTRNGEDLPVATYYYVLRLGEDLNGNMPDQNDDTGYVVILR